MADLVVIVPTRGRTTAAIELAAAFRATCTADTWLVFAVDESDPVRHGYAEALDGRTSVTHCRSTTMVEALNEVARLHANEAYALGFMGDDHRPLTVGWDAAYLEALKDLGTGIVYGNDLLQSENLPTQCAMTAGIVRALGWMSPPVLTHLYVDTFWKDLGQRAECLRYLPDVVVEHMHPIAGKAEWTEGHQRVNDPRMYQRDRVAYTRFCADGGFAAAVAKVAALR